MSEAPSCLSADAVKFASSHGSYVRLNVGGCLFYTTLGTLTKHEGSMLKAMFSGRMEVMMDSEGRVC
jgi:BTB/POZ domain-containing adapter for CUL3-mediated RhoA degradation protein